MMLDFALLTSWIPPAWALWTVAALAATVAVLAAFGDRLAGALAPSVPAGAHGFAVTSAIGALGAIATVLRSLAGVSQAAVGGGQSVLVALVTTLPSLLELLNRPLIAAVVFGALGVAHGYTTGVRTVAETLRQERGRAVALRAETIDITRQRDAIARERDIARSEVARLMAATGVPQGARKR